MLPFARAGIAVTGAGPGFARPTEHVIGNAVPAWTGTPGNRPDRAGPHPRGQHQGGNLGHYDGISGTDPGAPPIQPHPRVVHLGAEQENWNRPGIIGFNDRLQVRDRHAYWDTGSQRAGTGPSPPGNPPSNHAGGPPRPDLRTVNISVNPQIGSDATASQDDLSRPYTWLGQNDGSVVPVYGGVPGLYTPYGSRGGIPYPVVDPSSGQGGPELVRSGPPHGLHSDTYPPGKHTHDRIMMMRPPRPPRLDRPDNSRIGGQSYSQTVQPQGGTARKAAGGLGGSLGLHLRVGGRGWAGGQGAA